MTTKQQETDEAVVERVCAGDKEVYGILIERYEEKLTRYIRRFTQVDDDISDIIQVVFVKAYTNLLSFDSTRSFNAWLYRIAHNEAVNYLKKRSGEKVSFIDFDSLLPHLFADEESHTLAEKEETRRHLEKALHGVSPKYREVLVLYYFDDFSYEEIADVLHIPRSTVGVRIQRGKDALKQQLEANNYIR